MHTLIPLPVAIPLGVAAILAALNAHLPRRIADAAAILATLAAGVITFDLMLISRHSPIIYWFGGWTPRAGTAIGISFAIDPIGAGMATFASLLRINRPSAAVGRVLTEAIRPELTQKTSSVHPSGLSK